MSGGLSMAFAALVVASPPAPAVAASWGRARSARFEVTSDAGPEEARDAVRRLERLQDVLERLLPAAPDPDLPVTPVLLLRARPRFEALVPAGRGRAGDVAGFLLAGSDGPRIVVWSEPGSGAARSGRTASEAPEGEAGERWRTLDHELVHLRLARVLPAQPAWLAEGLAEALSGGELDADEARLAALSGPRLRALAEGPRLDVAQVVASDWESPAYRGDDSTGAFYAGSFALVRWLLAERGLPSLVALAEDVAKGDVSGAEAFAARCGSVEAVRANLLAVSTGPLLRVTVGQSAPVAVAAASPGAAEVDVLLGELLMQGGHAEEARSRFEAALRSDPAEAGAHAGLARLALSIGRWDEARHELRAALAARPDDAQLLLRTAQLLLGEARHSEQGLTPAIEAEAIAALEKAIALDPQLVEAACLLAHERPQPLARRSALLARAFARDPGRTDVGLTLAWLHVQSGDIEAARLVVRRSRDAARDEAYRFLCQRQLAQLGSYARSTVAVVGRLRRLDCRSDGSLALTLQTDAGSLRLEAASLRSFFVGGGTDELVLACGAQDLPVRVRYGPPAAPGLPGQLLTLDPWRTEALAR